MPSRNLTAASGFALVDLVVATLILSVLAGIGIGGYRHVASRVRQASARTAMIDTLMRAGTHATLAGQRLVVCPSTDQDTCSAHGSEWSHGWISFLDSNADRMRSADERVVGSRRMSGQVRIISSIGRPVVTFTRRGDAAGSNVTFTFCNRDGRGHVSGIAMGNAALWRTVVPTAAAAARCKTAPR